MTSEVSWHLTPAGILPSFSPSKSPSKAVDYPRLLEALAVHKEAENAEIPEYEVFTDAAIFNTEKALRGAFLNPAYMLQNFSSFLADIGDTHVNDPINFASVRDQSLRKFLTRRNAGLDSHWATLLIMQHGDAQRIEDYLIHELLKCRIIMRMRVQLRLRGRSCYRKAASEQLVQGNFINYMWHVLKLPECSARQALDLTDTQKRDYDMKRAFGHAADALHALKPDNYEGDILAQLPRIDLVLQSIRKIAVDFVLLEKYAVQILAKLNNDFLIEGRITSHLFSLHHLNLQLGNQESLKVLVFNSSYSAAYSWQLAVTIPFVYVFEASLLSENLPLSDDHAQQPQNSPSRTSLKEKDLALYKNFFSRLGFADYAAFKRLTYKELADLQQTHGNKVAPGKLQVKPINFEYYSRSLSTIQSDTFHVIQCRDMRSQVSPSNYERLLREFHRLLKSGGVLELPMVLCGLGETGLFKLPDKRDMKRRADWLESYTFDTMRDIIAILGMLFGAQNVKFSTLLLTSKNRMISYLINYTGMLIRELLSELEQADDCTRAAKNVEELDENDLNFYFYIRAEKA
ncbi:hypothetical protein METBIDRAFT_43201 [Metschnikowia bicuspidata var. bicuspidata NRRL YB-4993]|uniref:Uncharacterized protein n=1 Tax=Metschnikowia bicuspidata var. bicuspidata NRRL YB-4993 TaxID=869754 RepID=A0A1A0HAB4_9ASCO|nr:hypothetical protein METBIDRAFT_43201 [Metschnikowia bicuspidata var. bicuspidata NRRL YB-4993]OBA20817.1 hypothetical protein METBIDRAFT_43201 [Metschnikowia bicuspidata var. bicuspidata NRRL YB-4993]